eukprot:2345766-Amphidinium_carterae.1
MSADKYDAQQYQHVLTGVPRSYRIVDMHRGCEPGGLFHRFLQDLAALTLTDNVWDPIVLHERALADSFRYSLRSAATAYELVIVRCRGYPAKLFRLLDTPGLAEEIVAQWQGLPCMFDAFSAKHMSSYPSQAELLSLDSLKTL